MPIGVQTPITSHTGNGTATVFAYEFAILSADDIKVKVDGSIVTTGFTVAGIGDRDGGTVTFSVAPGSGIEVLLYREVSRERATDYQYAGDLREDVLDDDLDRIVMALQEDAELIARGIRVPVGESLSELPAAASRVDKVLTFGAGGAIALVDVAAFAGGGVVELVPADGSITLAKLATAVQSLINGALQKSGGTMTGKITLDGNAVNDLHPVTKQQHDAAIAVSSAVAFRNLTASATGSSATVSVAADEVLVRDSGGAPRLLSGVSLSIDSSASGANGLDTGSRASNTWYSIWVIWNGTVAAGLLSLSATAPTMPSGYTHKARVGWCRTASSNPMAFNQRGRRVRWVNTGSGLPSMAGGGPAGSVTTPTWVAVSTSSFSPTTASSISIVLTSTGSAGGQSMVAPSNSYGVFNSTTNPPPLVYTTPGAASLNMTYSADLLLESANVYWAHSGNFFLFAAGWEDNL